MTKKPPIQFVERYPETPIGWVSNYVVGYNLDDSVTGTDGSFSVQMVKVCHNAARTGEKRGEVVNNPQVMLLYFAEPMDDPLIDTLFNNPPPKAIALICIVVAVIAVSTVSIVRKKKKTQNNCHQANTYYSLGKIRENFSITCTNKTKNDFLKIGAVNF